LVPNSETDEDINLYLAEASEINPTPFFSSLEEVRQFLQENRFDKKIVP
jgi:hypothetical protein